MKSKFLFAATAVAVALAATPATADEETATVEEATKAKKPKKITDKRHPEYVRCRSRPVIGSLARKRRICMTNREWVAFNQEGNKRSREMVDDLQSGLNSSN